MNRPALTPLSTSSVAIALAAVLLVASCSGGSGNEASGPTMSTNTPATTDSTIARSSTTETTATSAISEPTASTTTAPQWTEKELAIIQAHDIFRGTYFDSATLAASDLGELNSLATAEYGASLRELFAQLRAEGTQFSGTYEYTTVAVELTGPSSALVRTCALDRVSVLENGVEIDPPNTSAELREALLINVDGSWLVDGANDLGSGRVGEPCDL